jgi:hypothetical protein
MTESQQYCNDMRELFMTAGWKLLLEEFEDTVQLLNDIRNIPNSEVLEYNKGMLAMINSLINLPSEIEGIEQDEVH